MLAYMLMTFATNQPLLKCFIFLQNSVGDLETIEENYTFLLGLTDYVACECHELGLDMPPAEAVLWDYDPVKYIDHLAETWKKFLPSARTGKCENSSFCFSAFRNGTK